MLKRPYPIYFPLPLGSAQVKEERDVFGEDEVQAEDDVIEAFDEMPVTGLAVPERSNNSNNDSFALLPFGEHIIDTLSIAI